MDQQKDDFLPQDYDIPNNSNYMKLEQGENRIRIFGKPILGWLDWKDKKPLRFEMDVKPKSSIDPKKPVRHFWAFMVWNYAANRFQIMEVTQKGIQASIKNLSSDPEWGPPSGYDIKIIKDGSGLDTEYAVVSVPHRPVSVEIENEWVKMGQHVDLNKLFSGDDPFSNLSF